MLWIFTYGILFFGVPHQGSQQAAWGIMVARIAQLFGSQPNESFIGSVEEGSDYNARLSERFKPLLEAFKFFSIVRRYRTSIMELTWDRKYLSESMHNSADIVGKIVERASAILGLPDSQEVRLYPNRTHRTICKFSGIEEPEWQQISGILVQGAACATNYSGYSPSMIVRQMTTMHTDAHNGRRICATSRANELTLYPGVIRHPYSAALAMDRARQTLNNGEWLLDQLREGEVRIRDEINQGVFWVLPFVGMVMSFFLSFFLPALLPRPGTIIARAEHVRDSQEQLIASHRHAIQRLDAHRAATLEVMFDVRSSAMRGDLLPPNDPLLRIDGQLSRQVQVVFAEIQRRDRLIPEEVARLGRIEDGLREGQGMDSRQVLEMLGRRGQEERDIQQANRADESNDDDSICPTGCIIL